MGVYSQNRTFLAEGVEVAALEGYNGITGANIAMIEGIQEDQAMFEAVIANDFAIAESAASGVVTESEIQAITEGTFDTIVQKIKELLQKLMSVVAGITKKFTAKLAGLLIRDNKTLVTALKKRINKTDFSKFDAKFIKSKNKIDYTMVSNAGAEFIKEYDKLDNVKTKDALSNSKKALEDQIEKIYAVSAGVNGAISASEFKSTLHKNCFEEKESVAVMSDIVAAMNNLTNWKDYISKIKKAESSVKKTANSMVNKAKKQNKSASSDIKDGEQLSDANIAQAKYDIASAYRSAILSILKGMMSEIKFGIKQDRSLVVKAAAYTPAKHESVEPEYFEALTEASDFEVDTTFEDPGYDEYNED